MVEGMGSRDIKWLAGLLEGEGHFGLGRLPTQLQPRIILKMTDRDIVQYVAEMLGANVLRVKDGKTNWKPAWVTHVTGVRAVAWMLAVFPFMGVRRRESIMAALHAFEHHVKPDKPAPGFRSATWARLRGRPLAKHLVSST